MVFKKLWSECGYSFKDMFMFNIKIGWTLKFIESVKISPIFNF